MDSEMEENPKHDISVASDKTTDDSFELSKSESSTDQMIVVTPSKPLTKAEREKIRAQMKEERERKTKERMEKRMVMEKERIMKKEMIEKEKEKKMKIKEEREREKREKDKLKEEERIKKQQLKEEIAEMKRVKDEEKQRKHNEKVKAEEEKRRKLEKSQALLFKFVKKEENVKNRKLSDECHNYSLFRPFQLMKDQTIAPIVPQIAKERFVLGAFDASTQSQDCNELYIELLQKRHHFPIKLSLNNNHRLPDLIIDEPHENALINNRKLKKFKHLQFHENVRPAYHGTWSKISNSIRGRTPFAKDNSHLDYDVDSDEEWDEGGPGESLNGSDSEGSEKADDYEIDNDIFVPHGYLSSDENEDENCDAVNSNDNNEDADADAKTRPLLKEQVLMAERNKSFGKMTPIVFGCVWESKKESSNDALQFLKQFKRVSLRHK